MGCGGSSPRYEEASPMQRRRSSSIDQTPGRCQVKNGNNRNNGESVVRMLLLGAGESGKSTILKQMRILYGTPPSNVELEMFRAVIRSNVISAMEKLLCIIEKNTPISESLTAPEEKEAFAELYENLVENKQAALKSLPTDMNMGGYAASPATKSMQQGFVNTHAGLIAKQEALMFMKHIEALKILWASEAMKDAWVCRAQENVNDGHKLFLENLDEIASPDYIPSQADILLSRIRTNNPRKERFVIKGKIFDVTDIGGQRSERRKWMDEFDKPVDAVIFVAALSEYDQNLTETSTCNRMIEALELFSSVCNNDTFEETPIILFLNKKDIFAEKIMFSHINDQKPFEDYNGPKEDFNNGVQYFMHKFKQCVVDEEVQDNFVHVTDATDTKNMEFVLDATREIILNKNLIHSGFG